MGANVARAAAHVILLETSDSRANGGFDFAWCVHRPKALPIATGARVDHLHRRKKKTHQFSGEHARNDIRRRLEIHLSRRRLRTVDTLERHSASPSIFPSGRAVDGVSCSSN